MELPQVFNTRLLSEPLNWLIVGVIATIWLLAFHVIMQGFSAMKSASGSERQAPGQRAVAGPLPDGGGYEGVFSPS